VELRDYLAILRRRKYLVAGVTMVCVVVALVVTSLLAPRYTATATLRVQPGTAFVGGVVRADDLAYVDRLENTYADLAKSRQVIDEVVRQTGMRQAPEVEVHGVANTELMDVDVTTGNPEKAAAAANALAAELVAHVRALNRTSNDEAQELFNSRAGRLAEEIATAVSQRAALNLADPSAENRLEILTLTEQITSKRASLAALRADYQSLQLAQEARSLGLSVVAKATPPTQPSNRHLGLTLGIALVLGLVASAGLAFLAENLTLRFRTRDEIEKAVEAPILAAIPDVGEVATDGVFNSGSKAEEAFRRLATAVLAAGAKEPLKTIMVTSAEPNQGKSTVVANLGRTLAQSGRSVLLVDANLRSPVLHEIYGLPNEEGLSDLLVAGPPEEERLLRPAGVPGLWILPAGSAANDPAMLLGSLEMERWVSSVENRFDFVLFDSPAVLGVTDPLALARSVDAVLLVAREDVLRDRLSLAHRELLRLNVRFLGIVINRVVGQRDQYEFFDEVAGVKESDVPE
jgi:capsular exopolysaccharide synthesis family protein